LFVEVNASHPACHSFPPRLSSDLQVALAYQRRIPSNGIYLSTEVYYKTMANLIGYEEGTNLFLNTDFESRLIQGRGRAYGFELRSEEHTSELQSRENLVCRLLLEN